MSNCRAIRLTTPNDSPDDSIASNTIRTAHSRSSGGYRRVIALLALAAAAAAGLVVLFLALLVATDGAGRGFLARLMTLLVGTVAALWLSRRRSWRGRLVRLLPAVVAAALTVAVWSPTPRPSPRSFGSRAPQPC
jgi:peptidoglycan/LPS O-acetylase OafA/YrhL